MQMFDFFMKWCNLSHLGDFRRNKYKNIYEILVFIPFNNLNNSNDIIRVLAYFQLIKISIPYKILTNRNEFFLAVFNIL